MQVRHYNYYFELVEATRVQRFVQITNAIQKTSFIRNHRRGTYELTNGGYIAELKTYAIIDKENGYCLNNQKPLTYNECIELIRMYC